MRLSFTPATQRAVIRATQWTTRHGASGGTPPEIDAAAMLLGLLAETECRAAEILVRHDITSKAVTNNWPSLKKIAKADLKCTACPNPPRLPPSPPAPGETDFLPAGARLAADLEQSLALVSDWLAENFQNAELATEHVLLGLAAAEHEVGRWLRQEGVDPQPLREEIARFYGWPAEIRSAESIGTTEDIEPLSMDHSLDGLSLVELFARAEEPGSVDQGVWGDQARLRILRVIDAAANRSREGLRVVEDYVRFVLDDAHLTGLLKQLRHDLTAALSPISPHLRLVARETQCDVGTTLTTSAEQNRGRPGDVPAANLARLQESLRSLEEFGKLVDPDMAEKMKQLRYFAYTVHRAIAICASSNQRLAGAKLYVLIDGCRSIEEFERLARALVESGVHVIQLRDKRLDDRQLLARGCRLAALTSASPTLFIINDRPDLAALARADGVHVGQEELLVKDARSIVGPEALVGVSTHSIEQARAAVVDGADYIGVGPTFPSGTKQFDDFPGVELLQAVAAEISLPAFAIGGICLKNLDAVLEAGFSRIAVAGAVTAAEDAGRAAEELLAGLQN